MASKDWNFSIHLQNLTNPSRISPDTDSQLLVFFCISDPLNSGSLPGDFAKARRCLQLASLIEHNM